MFSVAEALRAVLPPVVSEEGEERRIDPVFLAFAGVLAESLDVPCRTTPLLVDALGGVRLEPPRAGKLQARDLFLGVLRAVLAPVIDGLPVAELEAGDFGAAAASLSERGRKDDGAPEWHLAVIEQLAEALSECENVAGIAGFYGSEGAYGDAAAHIAALVAGSPEDAAERFAGMMGMREMMAGATEGRFGSAAARLAVVVAVTADALPERGAEIARASFAAARPLARWTTATMGGGGRPFDLRARVLPLLFASAPDAEELDPIFVTLLFELAERVDLDARVAPILVARLCDVVVAPHRHGADQFHDAARGALAILESSGAPIDARVASLVRERGYVKAAELLGAKTTAALADRADVRAAEGWSAETWQAIAVQHFAIALRASAQMSEGLSDELVAGGRGFVFPSEMLARALACVVRASRAEDRVAFFTRAVDMAKELARVGGP